MWKEVEGGGRESDVWDKKCREGRAGRSVREMAEERMVRGRGRERKVRERKVRRGWSSLVH